VTLKELRDQSGLTQRELAYLLGVTEKAVQRWENGTRSPSRRHQKALAKRFGVEVDELAFG
jgi:transcriptional regulator with XRE-family HTH domain